MPIKHKRSFREELESIEVWKKKTSGIKKATWDGNKLTIVGVQGTQIFDRHTVECVIFANF